MRLVIVKSSNQLWFIGFIFFDDSFELLGVCWCPQYVGIYSATIVSKRQSKNFTSVQHAGKSWTENSTTLFTFNRTTIVLLFLYACLFTHTSTSVIIVIV